MRVGVLAIGSLYWDELPTRESWRSLRLQSGVSIPVSVPICYGRKSSGRNNTYTMILNAGGPNGDALLTPCRHSVRTAADLIGEAVDLWNAERQSPSKPPVPRTENVGARWGCVGAWSRPDATIPPELADEWAEYFRTHLGTAPPTPPVGCGGTLNLDPTVWPAGAELFDLILASATLADSPRPTARDVAMAWLERGNESYFFNNVRHGIRTPDDLQIWRYLKAANPPWVSSEAYREAVAILREEG